MTAKVLFPFLDKNGWDNSTTKVADRLLSHFLLSDYSQTYFFYPEVSSMGYLLHKHGSDIQVLCSELQTTLKKYFSKYFNDVETEVRVMTERPTSDLDVKLSLYVSFSDASGQFNNLAKIVTYSGVTIKDVVNYNNYGLD